MRYYGDKPRFAVGDVVEPNENYNDYNEWEYATVIECLPINCHIFHEKGWGYSVMPFECKDGYTEDLWYHEPFLQMADNPPID